MSTTQNTLPLKSVAIGLLFSVLLGPVGLLYASFWGGFFMIFLGLLVCNSALFFPILVFWISCSIWSVAAIEKYNRNLLTNL